MKHLFILVIFFMTTQKAFSMEQLPASGNFAEIMMSANKDITEGNVKDAISKYSSLIEKGYEDSRIYYNLGIAQFRNDELGKSIFSFKKALVLSPRDADINYNLGYAKGKTVDKIEDTRGLIRIYFLDKFPLSNKESYIFLAVLGSIVFLISFVHLFNSNDYLKWFQIIFGGLFVLFVIFYSTKFFLEKPYGVVMAKSADVYSGIGKQNVLLYSLHEGTEFYIMDNQNESWMRITLFDGKTGWIQKDKVLF